MLLRTSLAIFIIGLSLRIPTLWHPIEGGQRNAQTACLTANMIEEGRLRLDPLAPWRGDLDARLVQELPLYNLAVLLIDRIPGVSLDLSGRLLSLLFWIAAFWLLQRVWQETLPGPAHFWANLLFVLAPMNWYLSTAFMPETFLQLLAVAFLALTLDYLRKPGWKNGSALVAVAALGLLVKFPAFSHLGIFLAVVLGDRLGWRALFRPVFLLGGLAIVACLVLWSRYMETVNSAYFPYWTGRENLVGFIQPGVSRLDPTFWIRLTAYNLAFVLPLMAVPFAALGLVLAWRDRSDFYQARIWLYLLTSLFVGWLLWGKGAAGQSYYNLPNLVCFCAFFGMGVARSAESSFAGRWPGFLKTGLASLLAVLLGGWGFLGNHYLSRSDRVTLEVSDWVREKTQPSDIILYQPRHSAAVMDYEHQPLLSHASGRRTWIWTRSTPAWEKQRALETSAFLIVTAPPTKTGFWETLRRAAGGLAHPVPGSVQESFPGFFRRVAEKERFIVFVRTSQKYSRP